jgi:predicted RNA-binding protein with PUA-like domain
MKMKKGECAFFYHSNIGKEIVGVVEVVREHHPDPTAEQGEPWVVVDFSAREPMPNPVTLEAVKAEPKLKDMALMKYSRLSVQPVTDDEWKLVCKMGGLKA